MKRFLLICLGVFGAWALQALPAAPQKSIESRPDSPHNSSGKGLTSNRKDNKQPDLTQQTTRAGQQDDIQEAVFRYMFADAYKSSPQPVRFLQVVGKEGDPSDVFLKRFQKDKIPVKK